MLEVYMHTTIQSLFDKGYIKTNIGEIVGADRKTIRLKAIYICGLVNIR